MNLKGKKHVVYRITRMTKAILKKEKNVPIALKYKGDSERDNKEMEGETIAKEPKTDQDNIKKDRQHKDETDTNPTDTLVLISQLIQYQVDKGKHQNHCQKMFMENESTDSINQCTINHSN